MELGAHKHKSKLLVHMFNMSGIKWSYTPEVRDEILISSDKEVVLGQKGHKFKALPRANKCEEFSPLFRKEGCVLPDCFVHTQKRKKTRKE